MWENEPERAEQAARESYAIYEQSLPALHPDRVLAQTTLADVLIARRKVGEAEPLLKESLESQIVLYGEKSSQVAATYDSLSQVKRVAGLLSEAEEYARKALDANAAALGDSHYMTGYFRSSLASLLSRQNEYREAEQQLRMSLDVYSKTLPPDHQYVASSEHMLGEVMLGLNRLNDAEALLTAALHRWRRTGAPPTRAARTASVLGEVLYRLGRTSEAEKYLVEGYRVLAADAETVNREERIKARERVTRFYTDRGQRDKLEALMLATNESAVPPPQARQN
jgi:tetratricopeptide (TPR) repeat protein